ncbi:MAG TPA: nuclear transport factor 2 family protein [Burkholderiaceae bacterium]|jgi:ketosteroid isomerase-like protein
MAATPEDHKQRLQAAFAELAVGNGRPFVDLMADDFCWTVPGSGPWAGTYRGKRAVREELFKPLFAQFATPYTNRALRFIAEGDHVVVECRGAVRTVRGQDYGNAYCYVCRFGADGRLAELNEYMDTALIDAVLEPPARG